MKKKAAVFVLVLALMASLCAPMAEADGITARASGSCGSGVTYALSGSTLYIGGSGAMTDNFVFPFESGTSSPVTTVVVNRGVTHIGTKAFYNFRNLTSVSLPDTVKTIGSSAFEQCRSLTSVHLPEGLTTIGKRAFYYCRYLEDLTLPSTVRTIGQEAFMYCMSLGALTIPRGVTTIESKTFGYCTAMTSVQLPETLTTIRLNAFAFSGLQSVVLPDSVTTLGSYAFYGSDLERAVLSAGLTTVDDYVFQGCTALREVTIPASVTTIGQAAFHGCGFETLVLPDTVTVVDRFAFADCTALRSVRLPGQLTGISEGLLQGCTALQTVVLPGTLSTVAENAFDGCGALAEIYYDAPLDRWDTVTVAAGNEALDKAAWYGALTVTRQPADVRSAPGHSAAFTVAVNRPDGVRYCWQYSRGGTWQNIGSSTATLTLADAGNYGGCSFRCVVTDARGVSVTSRTATLTLAPAPVITAQPVGVTVHKGETARVQVSAAGDDLSYAWFVRLRGSDTWYRSSITDPVYAVTMDAPRMGQEVYCQVTDAFGRTVCSQTVRLMMFPTTLRITAQPVRVTAAVGQTAALSIGAEGDGLTYHWYYVDAHEAGYNSATRAANRYGASVDEAAEHHDGGEGSTYAVTVTAAMDGRRIYCVVTDAYGISVRSATVTLTVQH